MKIGFIGLGIMGGAMSANLIKKSNRDVFVFDFDESKVAKSAAIGAHACASSAEVVENADVIFTSVPKAEHVRAVHESVYDVIRSGQIFIDMSTIAPKDSVTLGKKINEYGAQFLDVPIVKSKQQAIDGTLGIYVGGPKEAYEKVKSLLELLGSDIVYMGENGKGITMKILHNMLVGEIQNGVNEMMLLAEKNGIDWQTFLKAISIGGANNFYIQTKAEVIGKRKFDTAFSVANMRKDVGIAEDMVNDQGIDLPGVKLVNGIYQQAIDRDLGNLDFSASFKVVESNAKAAE
ncbi:NAD(P)-dependent oxidoreductase [Loigolactobacillus coryniformis]|uniref:3-hydroxyisobutyrate dehydrogenase n=1 Tax=Loigolactobacillus coryniformis subsp. coryniformis KCTC 3167 = DSM 20001 TaxID=913848 RepID=A0A0R1EY80_9LACO|nr:NAD(P)-dependent oxidoreductase [Loigolactobacillus coryniformis]ATO54605.1 3-hydroxyisobutyrate dehydrogenase [Loigolactobacillus coryniformis subsp. coryniformis KCTC 3167 = DSM 20001]KRK14445.1 3-hydroxyisobutyrate dehydrogenase [Loigolactobacillus coryniformis subsp. coryniformis KCTC 3167 = DSM 20001]